MRPHLLDAARVRENWFFAFRHYRVSLPIRSVDVNRCLEVFLGDEDGVATAHIKTTSPVPVAPVACRPTTWPPSPAEA